MRLKICAVVLLSFLLVGCSQISSGLITQKEHHDGYYYPTMVCTAYNKNGGCTVYITQQNWNPPDWIFDIKQGKKTGWVYVSEDTYGRYQVGDYFEGDK